MLVVLVLLMAGCSWILPEHTPTARGPEDLKRITFEIVARGKHCEPAVLAADRQGGALLLVFKVNSVGQPHWFIAPNLGIRKLIPANSEVEIPLVVEWSGIFEYGCTGLRWLGPTDSKGKLAIK